MTEFLFLVGVSL